MDDARPTDENAVSQSRWSWSRVDRLGTGVVIAIALSSAAWQARQELFGTGHAASGGSSSRSVSSAPSAADYTRLIDDEHFHVQLGVAYGNSGMLDQAIFHEREALRVNPGSLAALSNQGYYLYLKGDFKESASALERALTVDPHSDLARNNLHMTYARAIETAASEQERRLWQDRRLALGATNLTGVATVDPARSR